METKESTKYNRSSKDNSNEKSQRISLINHASYIILPSKTHENYSYPDLEVSMYRLPKDIRVSESLQNLDFHIGVAFEKNGHPYIVNINWLQALKLNLTIGSCTLNLRQHADFINLLKTEIAYDGNGKKIEKSKLEEILDEIMKPRNPPRAEFLDTDFKVIDDILHIMYGHSLINGVLTPQKIEPLDDYLRNDCYINFTDVNKQGLPIKKSNKKGVNYWPPLRDNNSVALFGVNSARAFLYCYWNPLDSTFRIGVREAKLRSKD